MKSEKMNQWINRILGIDYLIAGVCLTVLICVTFFGVIFRYCLNNPIIWEEEVQLMMITWTIYFGAAAAFRCGSHIAIDMIVDMFPKKVQKIFDIVIYVITIYVLYYIMKNGFNLVFQFAATGKSTNILHIPSQYVYMAVPVGCVLMIVSQTIYFIRSLLNIKQEGEDEDDN